MPAVKFGFDVRRHLDSVDHQVTHQPVDDGILHYHSDQTGASQVAFSEFGIGQVLVFECRHTGQYPSAYQPPRAMPVELPGWSEVPGRDGSNRARNRRSARLSALAAGRTHISKIAHRNHAHSGMTECPLPWHDDVVGWAGQSGRSTPPRTRAAAWSSSARPVIADPRSIRNPSPGVLGST